MIHVLERQDGPLWLFVAASTTPRRIEYYQELAGEYRPGHYRIQRMTTPEFDQYRRQIKWPDAPPPRSPLPNLPAPPTP